MRRTLFFAALLCVAGCTNPSAEAPSDAPAAGEAGAATSTAASSETAAPSQTAAAPAVHAAIESGMVALSPANTMIQFVGTHAGDNPDPRTGVFGDFSGKADFDSASNTLKALAVEIQTESLVTPLENLNTHLKSPDFFDVREYPTAKFESTDIAAIDGEEDKYNVKGNLTLLETTKEVAFPATVHVMDGAVALQAAFVIDRTEFGMDYGLERINKEVAMTVAIGQETKKPEVAAAPPGGGKGKGKGKGGPGGGNPAEFFAQLDADKDGKLTGDEISERMRENLAETDTDGDGAVTLEEFQARMERLRAAGGAGGGPAGGGAGGRSRPAGATEEPAAEASAAPSETKSSE